MFSRARWVGWLRRAGELANARREVFVGLLVFVIAAIAFRWARGAAAYWTIDDAGITYAASLELVDHHSLAPSLEGTPVEGYSNPLLFFVVALMRLAGVFDPISTHIRLEMLVFAAMVTLVWSLLRSLTTPVAAVLGAALFATLQLITPATWTWNGSGLENVWVSAGLVFLLWLCVRTLRGAALSPAWGAVVFLVSITRPEAPVYVAAFYVALFAFARPEEMSFVSHARQVLRALVVTLLLYAVFLAWRRIAYSDWLPNTYYAKLHEKRPPGQNLRDYVLPGVLAYCHSGVLAGSGLALLLVAKTARAATCMIALLAASLALPLVAGADWMGEHRFATPFLSMAHVCFCVLAAVCFENLLIAPKHWRAANVVAMGVVVIVVGLMKYERIAIRDDIPLNDTTLARVAHLEGGLRWEQQMRLGVPFPVVQVPDAGGSLMVGAMQMLDNGYLTDFQMARIGRNYGDPIDLRVLDQYQHEERRPDLLSDNPTFALDRSYLGTRYLPPGGGVLWMHRALVEAHVDANDTLLYDGGSVRIYLSGDTVRTAGPKGLVRCELLFEWKDFQPGSAAVRASIENGDNDRYELVPSQRIPSGTERFALLIGAPERQGSYPVSIDVWQAGRRISGQPLMITVTDDPRAIESAANELLRSGAPSEVAHRIAWLREQLVPRLDMREFRSVMNGLIAADRHRSRFAGWRILRLRSNATLASLHDLPQPIRTAEITAMRQWFATCASAPGPKRVACLGRIVDELRRLGYLDTLSRLPEVAKELDDARDQLNEWSAADRYRALVGLTLADASDVSLQRMLLAQRRDLARLEELPTL